MKYPALLCAILSLSVQAFSQTRCLEGTVTDDNSRPVPGARIILLQGSKSMLEQGAGDEFDSTLTDSEGNYSFQNLAERLFNLKLTAAEFKDEVIVGVMVDSVSASRVNFRLEWKDPRKSANYIEPPQDVPASALIELEEVEVGLRRGCVYYEFGPRTHSINNAPDKVGAMENSNRVTEAGSIKFSHPNTTVIYAEDLERMPH